MSFLFYTGNIAIIVFLLALVGKQWYETNKLKKWHEEAQARLVDAESDMNFARQNHLLYIEQVYRKHFGHDVGRRVEEGSIFDGMPMNLLLPSLGMPDKIQEGRYKNMLTSKWYYGESINRLGNPTFEYEVTLENHVVVGWKELN